MLAATIAAAPTKSDLLIVVAVAALGAYLIWVTLRGGRRK